MLLFGINSKVIKICERFNLYKLKLYIIKLYKVGNSWKTLYAISLNQREHERNASNSVSYWLMEWNISVLICASVITI